MIENLTIVKYNLLRLGIVPTIIPKEKGGKNECFDTKRSWRLHKSQNYYN